MSMYLHPTVPLGWQTGDGGGPSNGVSMCELWAVWSVAEKRCDCACTGCAMLLLG